MDALKCGNLWLILTSLLAILVSPGCGIMRQFVPPKIDAPVVFTTPPTKEMVAQVINTNSAKVQRLQSQVTISAGRSPGLQGTLAFERPRNVRLNAELFGMTGTGVDFGSNEELFWVWVKGGLPGTSPAIFYARHAEFAASGAGSQIPMRPEWIADALGLTFIEPSTIIAGPVARQDKTLEIRTNEPTPQGFIQRAITVDPKYGWIRQQSLADANGKLLVVTSARDHYYDKLSGISLPRQVELTVNPGSQDEFELNVRLNAPSINQITGDPNQLWTIPNPQGVQAIDISNPANLVMPAAQPTVTSIQSTVPTPGQNSQAYLPEYRGRDLR